MEVLIYVDDGVVERSKFETPRSLATVIDTDRHPLRAVDRSYFLTDGWEKRTGAVVLPGGRDIPYTTALNGAANTRIRRFVESGGCYLGFCAGGYYGAQRVEFDRGHPLEVVGERELAFFPGEAVGPAYGAGSFSYDSDTGARAAVVSWHGSDSTIGQTRVFYNGGCVFRDADRMPNTTILARYTELPGAPAAIVACEVGAGTAILSGVHPEYSAPSFRSTSGVLASIYEQLSSVEDTRVALLRDLMRRAGLTIVE